MAAPLFSDNPPLTEEAFEEYVREKELKFLRELAIEYNNREDTKVLNRIDLNRIGDDKLALTVSLWQRDIIPSTIRNFPYLINGERVEMEEPYLSILIKHSQIIDDSILEFDDNDQPIEETDDIYVYPEETYTYLLMKYPHQLLGFMAAGAPFPIKPHKVNIRDITYKNNTNSALMGFGLSKVKYIEEFIDIIKSLSILELITLALEINHHMGFEPKSDLDHYIQLVGH